MEMRNLVEQVFRRLKLKDLDAFEVAAMNEDGLTIEVKHQLTDLFQRSRGRGIAIRVVQDGRVGFGSTTDISSHAINQMIDETVCATGLVAVSEEAMLPSPQKPAADLVEKLGRMFASIPDDEKIRKVIELESAAIAADPRITKVQHARFEERVWSLIVVSSKGIDASASRGIVSLELKAVAEENGESQGAYEFEHSPCFEELDALAIGKKAAERALFRLGARPVAIGRCPVLFDPRAAATIVRLIAPSFFADNVGRGKSVIAKRRGGLFYSPLVSIVDDGLLPGGFGSFPFDGEGIPKRRTIMIRDGVVEGWLYDGPRAARDSVSSTGSCSRKSLRTMPTIGVSNCFLKGGLSEPQDIVRGMEKGILITDLLGAHTANTISGDFSLGAEGAFIEGGMIGAPVRGITVAGNVHELFRHVVKVGNDLKFFAQYGAVSMLIEELMIGA